MAKSDQPRLRDLGLSYEGALHGVQSAIAYEISTGAEHSTPKHLRVGVDARAADALALCMLLIQKGIFTEEEYIEFMRLGANEELARREDQHHPIKFR